MKLVYEADVGPSLRRHQHHVGPAEQRRFKSKKARKREAKRLAREGET